MCLRFRTYDGVYCLLEDVVVVGSLESQVKVVDDDGTMSDHYPVLARLVGLRIEDGDSGDGSAATFSQETIRELLPYLTHFAETGRLGERNVQR